MATFPKPTKIPNVQSDSFNISEYIYNFFLFGNFKTTVILLYAILALTAWKYLPAAPRFADPDSNVCILANSFNLDRPIKPLESALEPNFSSAQFLWNARKIWSAFFLMGVFPALIVKFVFKENLRDYGFTLGIVKRTAFNICLFLPIMLAIGWFSGNTQAFYNVYPYNPLAGLSPTAFAIHSLLYLFLYYLAWEFMFRGFIQIGLTEKLGAVPAILIQVVASTMLHYGHPASETFGCIAGGLLWGFLVYRTKSIYTGWAQHAILGIALDWSLIVKAL